MNANAFACEVDAIAAAKAFEKKLRYHTLTYHIESKLNYRKKGRPSAGNEPVGESWYIRWVFQIFENVLLFTFKDEQRTENMVMNMDDDNHTVIKCLGPPFEKIYFLN